MHCTISGSLPLQVEDQTMIFIAMSDAVGLKDASNFVHHALTYVDIAVQGTEQPVSFATIGRQFRADKAMQILPLRLSCPTTCQALPLCSVCVQTSIQQTGSYLVRVVFGVASDDERTMDCCKDHQLFEADNRL
jgi:hypothetical protein